MYIIWQSDVLRMTSLPCLLQNNLHMHFANVCCKEVASTGATAERGLILQYEISTCKIHNAENSTIVHRREMHDQFLNAVQPSLLDPSDWYFQAIKRHFLWSRSPGSVLEETCVLMWMSCYGGC